MKTRPTNDGKRTKTKKKRTSTSFQEEVKLQPLETAPDLGRGVGMGAVAMGGEWRTSNSSSSLCFVGDQTLTLSKYIWYEKPDGRSTDDPVRTDFISASIPLPEPS